MPLLSVRNLRTHFFTDAGIVKAVDGVSFDLKRRETLCLVGESGSGKSVLALSLMRLVPDPPGRIVGGEIFFGERDPIDLLTLPEKKMRGYRGKRIAMIFQEPMTSLSPVHTIGDQIGESLSLHEGLAGISLRARVIQMLDLVGIPDARRRAGDYPHQLSGGMRQRVMIAMALSCTPDILIADEPTTALDVTIQAQITQLMKELQRKFGMALILVTHDLGVVAEVADRVIVMYANQFVEGGSVQEIFSHPAHPYTQGLLASVIPKRRLERGEHFATIPGRVPDLAHLPKGCFFAKRCPKVADRCRNEVVPDDPCGVGRLVRCFFAERNG